MNYVIAVFPDRIQAEAAYSALEAAGLPATQLSIVGKGYRDVSELELVDPGQAARKQARLMAFWLVPFGFVGGVAFNLSTQYQLVPSAGVLGNQLLGGLFGAIAGAMGSFFVGGGVGLSLGGNTPSYRNQLKQGKYLVVVQGAPNLTNKAMSLLRQRKPENVQSYVDPNKV